MTDQPSKLPQAGEVWRLGESVRIVHWVDDRRPLASIIYSDRQSSYNVALPGAWAEFTKDAEKIA